MRPKPVVTRHQADEDIDLASEYYLDEGGPDLAIAFIDEYESSTSPLSRFPLSGSPRLAHALDLMDLSQWPLKRFPYSIIYVDREHSIEIWRVSHGQSDIPTLMRDQD